MEPGKQNQQRAQSGTDPSVGAIKDMGGEYGQGDRQNLQNEGNTQDERLRDAGSTLVMLAGKHSDRGRRKPLQDEMYAINQSFAVGLGHLEFEAYHAKAVRIALKSKNHETARILVERDSACIFLRNEPDILQVAMDCNLNLHAGCWLPEDWTPLEERIQLLVAHGARIDSENQEGHTPLYYTCVKGLFRTFKSLIDSGADYHTLHKAIPNGDLNKPSSSAPRPKSDNINLLQVALDALPKIERFEKSERPSNKPLPERWGGIIEFLIDAGMRVPRDNPSLVKFLHRACFQGNMTYVEKLLNHGVEIEAKSGNSRDTNVAGISALHAAAIGRHRDIVLRLLQCGADVHSQGRICKGSKLVTPLQAAFDQYVFDKMSSRGFRADEIFETCMTLVDAGANDSDREILMRHSILTGKLDFVRRLLQLGVKVEKLLFTEDVEVMRLLLDQGVSQLSIHLLPTIAEKGCLDVLKLLSERLSSMYPAEFQKCAAILGSVDMLKLLVENHGPLIRVEQDMAHIASEVMGGDHMDMLRYLASDYLKDANTQFLNNPAEPNRVNMLQIACYKRHPDAVRVLIDAGADPRCPGLPTSALDVIPYEDIKGGACTDRIKTLQMLILWQSGSTRKKRDEDPDGPTFWLTAQVFSSFKLTMFDKQSQLDDSDYESEEREPPSPMSDFSDYPSGERQKGSRLDDFPDNLSEEPPEMDGYSHNPSEEGDEGLELDDLPDNLNDEPKLPTASKLDDISDYQSEEREEDSHDFSDHLSEEEKEDSELEHPSNFEGKHGRESNEAHDMVSKKPKLSLLSQMAAAAKYESNERGSNSESNIERTEPPQSQIIHTENSNNFLGYQSLAGLYDIRLVILEPSKTPTSPIRCHLVHTNLAQSPRNYEALSYTWGDPTNKVPISLDEADFSATSNLWSALSRLRLETEPRTLWIDAICINQKDIEERNQQVSIMREIYSKADRVVVWVGEAADDSSFIFRDIKNWNASRTNRQGRIPKFRGLTRLAFEKFCLRPWFFRTWVVQEIAMSSNAVILCGSDEADWSDMPPMLAEPDIYTPLRGIRGSIRLGQLQSIQRDIRLEDVFKHNMTCLATDPRDKVYGLLGLFDHQLMPIDYNLSTSDVFRTCTQAIMQETRLLEMFHLYPALRSSDNSASWALNFSNSQPTGILPHAVDRHDPYDTEHYDGKLLPGWRVSDNDLVLKGKYVESIDLVWDKMRLEPNCMPGSEEFLSIFEMWEFAVSELIPKKRFRRAVSDALVDTLIALSPVYYEDYDGKDKFSSYAGAFRQWYSRYGSGFLEEVDHDYFSQLDIVLTWGNTLEKDVKQYNEEMAAVCYGRRLFTTDQGSLGLAPPDANSMDHIVFFPGALYPFVLRPRADGAFTYIGDCYLYDFTHDTFCKGIEESNTEYTLR